MSSLSRLVAVNLIMLSQMKQLSMGLITGRVPYTCRIQCRVAILRHVHVDCSAELQLFTILFSVLESFYPIYLWRCRAKLIVGGKTAIM